MEKVKNIERARMLRLIRSKGTHSDLVAYRALTGNLKRLRREIDSLATENNRLHMQLAALKADRGE